jgi:hypothetical protein
MIEKELESLVVSDWSPMPMGDEVVRHDASARAYRGTSGEWSVLVVSFDAGRLGRGYDGTATSSSRTLAVRLPRSLAAKLYGLAVLAASGGEATSKPKVKRPSRAARALAWVNGNTDVDKALLAADHGGEIHASWRYTDPVLVLGPMSPGTALAVVVRLRDLGLEARETREDVHVWVRLTPPDEEDT